MTAAPSEPETNPEAHTAQETGAPATGRSAIRHLRLVAFVEGVSYLALLGIAMPLKYFADMPQAVRVVGMAHGILFLLYVAAVARAGFIRRWPVRRWIENLVASLLPFGPFLADGRLRHEQRSI